MFVGIYDRFNSPDVTDYLFAIFYVTMHSELNIQAISGTKCGQKEVAAGNAERLFLVGADYNRVEAKRRHTQVPMLGNNATPVLRDVLRALTRALKKTEEAFFAAAEEHVSESPELGRLCHECQG